MTTTVVRSVRLETDLWDRLDGLAQADQRSTASLIRKVLTDFANAATPIKRAAPVTPIPPHA